MSDTPRPSAQRRQILDSFNRIIFSDADITELCGSEPPCRARGDEKPFTTVAVTGFFRMNEKSDFELHMTGSYGGPDDEYTETFRIKPDGTIDIHDISFGNWVPLQHPRNKAQLLVMERAEVIVTLARIVPQAAANSIRQYPPEPY